MSFEFSLEVLLEHKRRLQDEARRVWSEAQDKVDQATAELKGFYTQVDDTRKANQDLEKSGGALAARLVANDNFIVGQNIRIERQRLKIRDLKSQAEILHEQMVEALRETKTLEKLKEKQKEEYKKKLRIREMKENDEIVTLRHKREAWGSSSSEKKMSGYDKFFKEAGKASGLVTGKPAPKIKASGKASSKASGKASGNAKFKLSNGEATPRTRDRIMIGTPEEQLRKEIQIRSRAKKAASMKKRQAFPVFPAIIAVVALLSCGVGYFQPDLLDEAMDGVSQVSGIEIGIFGSANASEAQKTAKKADKKSDAKAAPAQNEAEKSASVGAPDAAKLATPEVVAKTETPADIRNWSDEELSFFNKLNDRKKELDLREAELAKLEEELQKQKVELDGKIKQLEDMRADISKTLKTRVAVDQEKVEKLVQTYSTMKAQNAAKIIETLNEDLAVEVMDKMKKKSAAEIMNMMDAKKARRISELLTGYQRTPAGASANASEEASPAAPAEANAE